MFKAVKDTVLDHGYTVLGLYLDVNIIAENEVLGNGVQYEAVVMLIDRVGRVHRVDLDISGICTDKHDLIGSTDIDTLELWNYNAYELPDSVNAVAVVESLYSALLSIIEKEGK